FIEQLRPEPVTVETRLTKARSHFGAETFSRKDYLALFKTISNATASRDLRQGVDAGQLTKSGDKATTRYRFL
ncbi:MAG: Fic family protein, partial [Opitutales bacterium]